MTERESLADCNSPPLDCCADQSKTGTHKRAYVQVDYEKRRQLLEVLNTEETTIKSAAAKLNINYSTAKNIVKLYRKDKRIHKLPKKAPLTLHKITTVPSTEQAWYEAALRPFYHAEEAENLLAKVKAKRSQGDFQGVNPVVTSLPVRTEEPKVLANASERPGYSCSTTPCPESKQGSNVNIGSTDARASEVPQQAPRFNFMIYSPIVMGT